jgi:LysM repeat protein
MAFKHFKVLPAAALALVMAAVAAPAPAPAQQTNAVDYYKGFAERHRRSIEYDLAWIGESDHVVDGIIARNAIRAIRRFERSIGSEPDGILQRPERQALARQAREVRRAVDYRVVIDGRTGARIGVPFGLLGRPEAAGLGARYGAPDLSVVLRTYRMTDGRPLRQVYDNQIARADREVTYETFRDDWFVVSGRTDEGRSFYTRAQAGLGEIRAWSLTYDNGLQDRVEPVIVAMSSDFDAFAAAPSSDPAPRNSVAGGPCADRIRVAAGETLARIAQRCDTTVSRLRRANDGVAPRDLRAGQMLRIPRDGEALPALADLVPPTAGTDYAPVAAVTPRRPWAGGAVAVSARGFPPNRWVEAGFSLPGQDFQRQKAARTDARGNVEFRIGAPARLSAGDRASVVVATPNGRLAARTEFFALRAAPPGQQGRERVAIDGMLTQERGSCATLRDVRGQLWSLRGGDVDGFAPGTAVRVTGYAMEGGCDRGRVLETERVLLR